MTVALMRGGKEHLGWGQDRYLMADIYDALNQNTRATGQWGKGGAPKIDPYPRPKVAESKDAKKAKTKVTVAQLFKRFQHRQGG